MGYKNQPLKLSKSQLIQRYVQGKQSSTRIAKDLGCDHKSVLKYLREYSIPIRNKREAQQINLRRRPTFSAKHRQNLSKAPHDHHVDMDKTNNHPSNILRLTGAKHRQLHVRGYEYLVEIGLVRQYIKWFDKNSASSP